MLAEGGDVVVVAIELSYDLSSSHVTNEELDVVVVEVEDLIFSLMRHLILLRLCSMTT